MHTAEQVRESTKRFLVVEDDEGIALLVQRVLGRGGAHSVAVGTAERAIEELGRGSFDALVADVWLPGMSGLDLVVRARRSHPALGIIVMTADVGPEIEQEAHRCGADDFLAKPFTPTVLRERIALLPLR